MKPAILACVLIITLLLSPAIDGAYAQSARDLNTEGYRLYLKGKFPKALDYFRRAVQADPDYALARYNLACTLGVLRKQGPEAVCRYDAYKSVILDHLEGAVRLDPETRKKAETDPDIDPVRDTVRYLRLFGYSPGNRDDTAMILTAVAWYGAAAGAFGPAATIDFRPDGTLALSLLDTAGDEVKHTAYSGTYFISGSRVTFILDRPVGGVSRFEGTILPGGSLDIPGLPGPFSDNPHECEA
jgi:tetratricopeptide (TPR) repeat protein